MSITIKNLIKKGKEERKKRITIINNACEIDAKKWDTTIKEEWGDEIILKSFRSPLDDAEMGALWGTKWEHCAYGVKLIKKDCQTKRIKEKGYVILHGRITEELKNFYIKGLRQQDINVAWVTYKYLSNARYSFYLTLTPENELIFRDETDVFSVSDHSHETNKITWESLEDFYKFCTRNYSLEGGDNSLEKGSLFDF